MMTKTMRKTTKFSSSIRWLLSSSSSTTTFTLLPTFLFILLAIPPQCGGGGSRVEDDTTTDDHDHTTKTHHQFSTTTTTGLGPSTTSLTTDPLGDLLVISTLDGTLTAVDRISGELRWVSRDDKPMIQVPQQQQKKQKQQEGGTGAGGQYQPDQDSTSQQQQHPQQHKNPKAPYFLPDPKTGSLYMMGKSNSLRKLPFTIPQLVSMAPCRNSEGLLYTGKKMDVWITLNPYTGEKSELPFDDSRGTCPASSTTTSSSDDDDDHCNAESPIPSLHNYQHRGGGGGSSSSNNNPLIKSILIGKTEYTLSMMDGRRRWNVTYHHYAAKDMSPQGLQDYELVHFTSPSTGSMVTYRSSGEMLWSTDLSSPVIALYSIEAHTTNLVSVPFNPIASDTLERLKGEQTSSKKALSPTTYVGECAYGIYAVPALADEHVLVISEGSRLPPLIEGPSTAGDHGLPRYPTSSGGADSETDYLLLGYYEVKETSGSSGGSSSSSSTQHPKMIEAEVQSVPVVAPPSSNDSIVLLDPGNEGHEGTATITNHSSEENPSKDLAAETNENKDPSSSSATAPKDNRSPNVIQFPPPPTKTGRGKEIKIVFTTAVISILISTTISVIVFVTYRRYKNRQLGQMQTRLLSSSDSGAALISAGSSQQPDSNGSHRSSGGSRTTSSSNVVTSVIDGTLTEMSVGKITLFPCEVLGKGCEGTFVFKGKFEGRDVAVKRILPECFAFADREVDLLKESDQHPNVIRYFCTETDGQFRYIALELCVATLSDWIDGRFTSDLIDPVTVLREATEGLAHLHSLRIVHRDVKPANVLLALGVGGHSGNVRTLISDFGLCKKIQNGRMSYSRRSGGVPGTDGWIAPEVVAVLEMEGGGSSGSNNSGSGSGGPGSNRMTYSVDIFSMGCVFYYVLTQGTHPFGDQFRRQSNILSGEHDLHKISDNPRGAHDLVQSMISMDPSDRPPLSAVLTHPLFWSKDKVLTFFLDVSDRVEKESEDTFPLLRRLEQGAGPVVRQDWRDHICSHVAMDLRRYRTYKGHSLRDLLRALRNKKNHYRELTTEAQESLGNIPDQFADYWVTRFPLLLPYTWAHFEALRRETVFAKYFHPEFEFAELLLPEIYAGVGGDAAAGNNSSELSEATGGPYSLTNASAQLNQPLTPLGKDFWRSKAKNQRWRGSRHAYNPNRSPRRRMMEDNNGGGGAGGLESSPFITSTPKPDENDTSPPPPGNELSASTDNYWRQRRSSRSPAKNKAE